MGEPKAVKESVWINGTYVLLNDFCFYEKKFEELLGKALKKEEKRVLVNDPEMKALKTRTFLFDDGVSMGVLYADFSKHVIIETLFFDFPLSELVIWPDFQLYRPGRICRKGNVYIPNLIKSSTGEKLDEIIHEILMGRG